MTFFGARIGGTSGRFFEGVCAPSNATAYLRDPPPIDSRISTIVNTPRLPSGLGLCRFVETDLREHFFCELRR